MGNESILPKNYWAHEAKNKPNYSYEQCNCFSFLVRERSGLFEMLEAIGMRPKKQRSLSRTSSSAVCASLQWRLDL